MSVSDAFKKVIKAVYVHCRKSETQISKNTISLSCSLEASSSQGYHFRFFDAYMYLHVYCAQSLSFVQLFVTAWTVACQASLFQKFLGKNTGVVAISYSIHVYKCIYISIYIPIHIHIYIIHVYKHIYIYINIFNLLLM